MPKRSVIVAITALGLGALVLMLSSRIRTPDTLEVHGNVRPSAASQSLPPSIEPPLDSSQPNPTFAASTFDLLNDIAAQLAAARDRETSRRLIAELRASLDRLPREAASQDVQSYLRSGNDAATQLDVTIKPGGLLDDASSLRVALLDYLGQIDKPAAGAVATDILSHYTTPDEWAVSLRNYAWANRGEDGKAYLQARARELLSNPEWIKNPTAGFLEAFDSIVYANAAMLTPQLADLVRDKGNRAVAHAAFLTLDRLVLAEPVPTLKPLVAEPQLLETREQTRANLFARVDIRDAEQKALLERYLLDSTRTQEELQTFAAIYPNANFMISNNLLTTSSTPTRDELVTHDTSALDAVQEWLRDPRFQKRKPQLEVIRSRLESFVRQGTESQ
jgi:hypothetical protein